MSTHQRRVGPFEALVEESFDEASFLWGRWEVDLSSLTRNLDQVWVWTEDRLGGALAGTRIATPALLGRLAERAISVRDPHSHSALANVLATAPGSAPRELLVSLVKSASGPVLSALIRGIEVAQLDGTFAPVTRVLAVHSPEHRAQLARLKAFQRASLGEELRGGYDESCAALQAMVMKAAGYLPAPQAEPWLEIGLAHPDVAVRVAAIESGVRLRHRPAWLAALAAAAEPGPANARLLRIVAMFGRPEDHRIIIAALGDPARRREALWALGCVGTAEAVEHCLEAMDDPAFARAAGEAYCAITGAELSRERLTAPESGEQDGLPPFQQDDLNADLVPRREDLWPRPDPGAVRRHWKERAARLGDGRRFLRGDPLDLYVLARACEQGPMLRRGDYAIELCARSAGQYDLEPRAMRLVQRRMMAAGRTGLTSRASGA